MSPLLNKRLLLNYWLWLRCKQRRRKKSLMNEENEDNELILILLRARKMRKKVAISSLMAILSLLTSFEREPVARSVRRHVRNHGFWETLWSYSDKRFIETLRITRATFMYILQRIRPKLERETLVEKPLSPECRLAVCLYRLGRGDYLYTLAELFGIGKSTVCTIIKEVCLAIIEELWHDMVASFFPSTNEEFVNAMAEMEQSWQFPYAFAAVDGCHIPIKCPPGGKESAKEYHNFKEFYSVVLMAMADSKYRFIGANCGLPGNTHDSMVFQATRLYRKTIDNIYSFNSTLIEDGCTMLPIVLGDSAFQFLPWLMKPYANTELNNNGYFNYRLSRARMVIESAYGQLKGRWRILLRKCESEVTTVKFMCLTKNPRSSRIRDILTNKFVRERESGIVF